MRLLKSKFDPSNTGILELDELFNTKPGNPNQNQDTRSNQIDLNPREKSELKSLLDEISLRADKSIFFMGNLVIHSRWNKSFEPVFKI